MYYLRLVAGIVLALLPSWVKIPLYRFAFGYRIGRGVRIGLTPLIGVGRCRIGDGVRIGSFNLFYAIGDLVIEDHCSVRYLNVFRGGRSVVLGAYCTVLRQNVFNSILDQDFVDPVDSALELGAGVVVTSGHWLDFSAGLRIGPHTIVGGRHSSFWTHNRQRGREIVVGHHCYLGSEIRVAPGVQIPSLCVVALGSVLTGRVGPPRSLIGGNPAEVIRPLREHDLFLVIRKTRGDIPDPMALELLPDDLHALAGRANAGVAVGPCPVIGADAAQGVGTA